MDLRPYLDDLEARLDDAVETALGNDWSAFCAGQFRGDIFSPRRRATAAATLSWPSPRVNAALADYSLMALRQLEPEAPIGLLYSCALVDPWLYAQHLKANALHPLYLTLQAPGLVEGCRATGIKLHPWTVDDPTAMGRLMAMNIDAVITNKPDVARAVREQS